MGKVKFILEFNMGEYDEAGGEHIQDTMESWQEVFFQSDALPCDFDIKGYMVVRDGDAQTVFF